MSTCTSCYPYYQLCVYTIYKELTQFRTYMLLYASEVVATVVAAAVTTIVLGH